MRITEECNGCGICLPYCPMEAIYMVMEKALVDLERCVECYSCIRNVDCPTDAIKTTKLLWPRTLAANLSNPLVEHRETRIPGRGTEEMKTNDVTNRFQREEVGFAVDVGRPVAGTTMRDVEKIATALARHKVVFEEKNPVTSLMKDRKTGELLEEVRDVRTLSAIIEFKAAESDMKAVLRTLVDVSQEIDTVFSLSVIGRVEEDGSIPFTRVFEEMGLSWRPNGKTNVGLGRVGD